MTAIIYFGTIHEPGIRHEIAFDSYAVRKNVRVDTPNITSATAEYFTSDGRLVAQETLDHLKPVCELTTSVDTRCLVFIKLRHARRLPFNVYGFIVNADRGEGITYPMSPAIGFPETVVWFNRAVMPMSAPPAGWHHEIFLANPSRWSQINLKLRLYKGDRYKTLGLSLAPKCSALISIEEEAERAGMGGSVDAIAAVARNKPILFIMGRNKATGAISFLEHPVTLPRVNFKIPAVTRREDSEIESENSMDRVFCFCNGMTLRQALEHEREGIVGNYCTGCRNDLRLARITLKKNPELAEQGAALGAALEGKSA